MRNSDSRTTDERQPMAPRKKVETAPDIHMGNAHRYMLPLPEVPEGKDESDNVEIRRWGEPITSDGRKFGFNNDYLDIIPDRGGRTGVLVCNHEYTNEYIMFPPAYIASNFTDVVDAAIEAHGLTCRFGDFVAVDHVDFRIERGEIFGFLGSNGCGKSTTMKMLTGLQPASEGEAFLFGKPVDPRNIDTRRRVGYMSQAFSLYSELSVLQNLDLHARLFHLPAERREPRIREMLERFELVEEADSLPEALPLGVRQTISRRKMPSRKSKLRR